MPTTLNDLPNEVLHSILHYAAAANEREGVTFTFGLGFPPLASQKKVEKYVRGPVPPPLLRWDNTDSIRHVCRRWHEWGLSYVFETIYVRRWRGGERWADLSLRRDRYAMYELNDPYGSNVYRNPYQTLTRTRDFFTELPQFAINVKRLWFDGLYVPETDAQIIQILSRCDNLTSVTLPWTLLRNASPEVWAQLLGVRRAVPLQSLELHAIDLPEKQAKEVESVEDKRPLDSRKVDFSKLERLKIFGDTQARPIIDDDLRAIARSATGLRDFQVTCNSTITLDGVMAIVKASQSTLKVLEHAPRAQDGFSHPHPGVYSEDEHICDILKSCPKLQDLSVSLPSMCADLFTNAGVLWQGNCQVRAVHLCGHDEGSTSHASVVAMKDLLTQARCLINRRATAYHPAELTVELFFADLIFDPHLTCVHGDFSMAELISGSTWPSEKTVSRKGPYGTTGLYGKNDEEHSYDRISEEDFFVGVSRTLAQL